MKVGQQASQTEEQLKAKALLCLGDNEGLHGWQRLGEPGRSPGQVGWELLLLVSEERMECHTGALSREITHQRMW